MWELLIMRELLSGRSWTSKVFNTVITLDTYQFLDVIDDPLEISEKKEGKIIKKLLKKTFLAFKNGVRLNN